MTPDQTLAQAKLTMQAIAFKANLHPDPKSRALELAVGVLRISGPAFLRAVTSLFSPPPLDQLTPKPEAQVVRELHELHRNGIAIVGALLVALDQFEPLPAPGALRGVNGGGGKPT